MMIQKVLRHSQESLMTQLQQLLVAMFTKPVIYMVPTTLMVLPQETFLSIYIKQPEKMAAHISPEKPIVQIMKSKVSMAAAIWLITCLLQESNLTYTSTVVVMSALSLFMVEAIQLQCQAQT